MRIGVATQGMRRAEQQIAQSAHRFANWGLENLGIDASRPQGEIVQLDGEPRARLYGSKPAQSHTISDEIISMKQAEFAFKANLTSLQSLLDLEKEALDLVSTSDHTS
jgi:hypothetical protein